MPYDSTAMEPASELKALPDAHKLSLCDTETMSIQSSTVTVNNTDWQPPARDPHMGLLSSCNMVN
jgi:hypothetical protein